MNLLINAFPNKNKLNARYECQATVKCLKCNLHESRVEMKFKCYCLGRHAVAQSSEGEWSKTYSIDR